MVPEYHLLSPKTPDIESLHATQKVDAVGSIASFLLCSLQPDFSISLWKKTKKGVSNVDIEETALYAFKHNPSF